MEQNLLIGLIGVFGAILGGIVGGITAFFIQKHTQERAWRREYGLRSIETIYAPLYKDMLSFRSSFENFYEVIGSWSISENCNVFSEVWTKIRSSYLFLMILDNDFRADLDDFYKKISEYSQSYTDARGVVFQNTKDILNSKDPSFEYNYWDLIYRPIFFEKNFDDFMIELSGENGPLLKNSIFDYWKKQGIDVPEDFFEQLQSKSNKDPAIENIRDKRKELIAQCDYFIKEISKRIEAPWKM